MHKDPQSTNEMKKWLSTVLGDFVTIEKNRVYSGCTLTV